MQLIIRPKPPKGEDAFRTFSVRISDEVVFRLDDLCEKTGYSRNALIGLLLAYAMDHSEVAEQNTKPKMP